MEHTYLDLCTQVYDLSKPTPPDDAFALYKSYASRAKGPILEPMCGSGRFMLPLIEEGFDVQGFDSSQHMLDALLAKKKAKVAKCLIEDFHSSDRFGLIFIPSGSFGLITDLKAAQAALKSFYRLLDEDGVLVFEAETFKSTQFGVWRGSVWKRADNKKIIANFLDLPLVDHVGCTVCKYELIEGHQIISTEIEELRVRYYDPVDLMGMIKSAGFKDVRLVKAFDITSKPDEADEVVVYECRK